jgi:hypothetical protein
MAILENIQEKIIPVVFIIIRRITNNYNNILIILKSFINSLYDITKRLHIFSTCIITSTALKNIEY